VVLLVATLKLAVVVVVAATPITVINPNGKLQPSFEKTAPIYKAASSTVATTSNLTLL
jgi:hypothetical protein